jgi:hypothetical protein
VNSIILKPGSPMHRRLQTATAQWIDSGRPAEGLLTGTAFFLAQCWLFSSGAHQPESPLFSPDIAEYMAAGKAALGGETGWNAMLHEKVFCSHCRMSFHLENLGICTDCLDYVCPACRTGHGDRCSGEVVG